MKELVYKLVPTAAPYRIINLWDFPSQRLKTSRAPSESRPLDLEPASKSLFVDSNDTRAAFKSTSAAQQMDSSAASTTTQQHANAKIVPLSTVEHTLGCF